MSYPTTQGVTEDSNLSVIKNIAYELGPANKQQQNKDSNFNIRSKTIAKSQKNITK